ncbi:MAG: DUF2298 domain-containing protein, partial [Anaerolineales bacterium]
HPHVLVMPFAFLSLGLALNLILAGGSGRSMQVKSNLSNRSLAWIALALVAAGFGLLWIGLSGLELRSSLLGLVSLAAGGALFAWMIQPISQLGVKIFLQGDSGEKTVAFSIDITPPFLLLSAVVLGGMAFLNTWDFPFYVAFYAASYLLYRYLKTRDTLSPSENQPEQPGSHLAITMTKEFTGTALLLIVAGVLLYLPFYLGFSSQAGGVLPSMVFITRGAHLWVMFGVLLVPVGAYLAYLWNRHASRAKLRTSLVVVVGFMLGMLFLSILLSSLIAQIPGVRDLFLNNLAAPDLLSLIQESLRRRLVSPGAWITLLVLLVFTLALLLALGKGKDKNGSGSRWFAPEAGYALLLVLFAGLLVVGPEFFYLRDQFGWRMNTIFKFYYTAWLMWGIVAAFGSAVLLRELSPAKNRLYQVVLMVVIGLGMVYTLLGFGSKTEGFSPSQGWTLDGTAYIARQSPGEVEAIRWLADAPLGVVAEAVGGSYSNYARVSTLSGQPTVLGWPGHESQWRGGGREIGSRQTDIQRLYCTRNWEEAQTIIQQYDIRYIFIGSLERSSYTTQTCAGGLNEAKFAQHLTPVYEQGEVTIYQTH